MGILTLGWTFLRIGLLSFGGGWTIVGVIRDEVLRAGWLTDAEFTNLVAIAQVTPGPVALNAATLVGFQRFGPLGAIVATLAVVAVPVAAVTVIAMLAARRRPGSPRLAGALKTGTAALVAMTLISLLRSPSVTPVVLVIAAASFLATLKTKINPLLLILLSGVVGGLVKLIGLRA